MAAYIVGMIVGAVCTIFPLVYLTSLNLCLAIVLTKQPAFEPERFDPFHTVALVVGITVVGAAVLLLSAIMAAITGLRRLRTQGARLQPELPEGTGAP